MICFNWCRAKPLAFYIFTSNKNERKLLIENIPCGGITCNDTIMHAGGKTSQIELNELNVAI
jgi:acyl-CoA reductase-like NAD-dependent aldehyde dehydrogenase